MADFNIAVEKLIRKEGGYVNDPDDTGGETKFGISKMAYPNLDIKNLTYDDAKLIYKRDYWLPINLDAEPSQYYAEQLFENAVNMGLGVTKAFLSIINKKLSLDDIKSLQLTLLQVKRYLEICNNREQSRKYLRGWLNRIFN